MADRVCVNVLRSGLVLVARFAFQACSFNHSDKGTVVNGVGDMPNQHDVLTGSQPDGRTYTDGMDHTCGNWTSNADGRGSAQLGHHDKSGLANGSWNSSHGSRGCSQANLISTGGNGYLYCFAVN